MEWVHPPSSYGEWQCTLYQTTLWFLIGDLKPNSLKPELDQVNGGGLILERLSVVLGVSITGGIAAGIMSLDTGTLKGPLVSR